MNDVKYSLTYPTYNLDKGVCVESEHDVFSTGTEARQQGIL